MLYDDDIACSKESPARCNQLKNGRIAKLSNPCGVSTISNKTAIAFYRVQRYEKSMTQPYD